MDGIILLCASNQVSCNGWSYHFYDATLCHWKNSDIIHKFQYNVWKKKFSLSRNLTYIFNIKCCKILRNAKFLPQWYKSFSYRRYLCKRTTLKSELPNHFLHQEFRFVWFIEKMLFTPYLDITNLLTLLHSSAQNSMEFWTVCVQ